MKYSWAKWEKRTFHFQITNNYFLIINYFAALIKKKWKLGHLHREGIYEDQRSVKDSQQFPITHSVLCWCTSRPVGTLGDIALSFLRWLGWHCHSSTPLCAQFPSACSTLLGDSCSLVTFRTSPKNPLWRIPPWLAYVALFSFKEHMLFQCVFIDDLSCEFGINLLNEKIHITISISWLLICWWCLCHHEPRAEWRD